MVTTTTSKTRTAPAGLRFSALGTDVFVASPAAETLAPDLRALVSSYEARFSRFLPNSELQQLSNASGTDVAVSEDMFLLLSLAMRFWCETKGIFDPLIRPDLEAAGYDRTFHDVPRVADKPAPPPRSRRANFGCVQLDTERRTVRLPEGASLDLGGIAKAWILERVAELLSGNGPLLVDIGGDMTVGGNGPDGGPGWLITVADPFFLERDLCWLRLYEQAIATSTITRRRWRRGERWLHHIIDPRTGSPAQSDVVQATVVAPTPVQADIYAKTALILGLDAGLAWLHKRMVPALLVTTNARSVSTPKWRSLVTPMLVH